MANIQESTEAAAPVTAGSLQLEALPPLFDAQPITSRQWREHRECEALWYAVGRELGGGVLISMGRLAPAQHPWREAPNANANGLRELSMDIESSHRLFDIRLGVPRQGR
jgi:hypothetical protein